MRGAILLITLLMTVTGCATLDATRTGPATVGLQPLNLGWERHLSLTWESAARAGGQLVSGYVRNDSPYDLINIRVLVEALDAGGRVVEQRVGSLPGELRGGGHLYFEVPIAAASAYRVRVFSYDRLESAGLVS